MKTLTRPLSTPPRLFFATITVHLHLQESAVDVAVNASSLFRIGQHVSTDLTASGCCGVGSEGVQGQGDVCVPRSDCFPEIARGWDLGPLAMHLEVKLGYGCQDALISQATASEARHGVLIFVCVSVRVCARVQAPVCGSGQTCHGFDLWASDSRHIWFNYPHPPVDLEAQDCEAWPPCPGFTAACVCACRCVCACVCMCAQTHYYVICKFWF